MLTKTILKTTLVLFASLSLFLLGPTDPDKPKIYEPLDAHLKVLEQTYVAADGHCDPGAQNLMILRLQVQNISPDLLLSEITPEIIFEQSGKVVSISPVEGSVAPGETFSLVTKILTRDCDSNNMRVKFKGQSQLQDPLILPKEGDDEGDNGGNDNCDEDQVPPVALCDNISVFLDASGSGSITAGDVDGGSYDNFWLVDWSVTPSNFDCNNLGANIVTLTVEDCNGNTDNCQASVTVVDQIPPTITNTPQDLTVECDGMGNLADLNPWLANQGGATATDACGPITWTNDYVALANGCTNFSPTGGAMVTFTATDLSGNVSTASANFLIVDTQAPVVTCPAAITVTTSNNSCLANVNFSATATDDCDGNPTLTYSHAPGSSFSLGITQVTITAKDECGNQSSCVFDVTVADNIPPTIQCPANVSVEIQSCAEEMALTFPTPPHSDNCAVQSITNDFNGTSDASGTYPLGTTVVTWTVVDASGNVTTCNFSVIVAQAPGYTQVCELDDQVLAAEPIQVSVLAPQSGSTNHTKWEPVPLIVDAKDFDAILQTCRCVCLDPDGVPVNDNSNPPCESQALIDIRDQVTFSWQIVNGPGTLQSTDRPATIFNPPPIGMTPFTTTIRVTVADSRNNDVVASATFVININPEGPCDYVRTISSSTVVGAPNPTTINSNPCDCSPQPPVWTVGNALTGSIQVTSNQIEACAGSQILLFATGADRDDLRLTCDGPCGTAQTDLDLVDEPVFTWTTQGGTFPAYGGSSTATTSSTQTAVVWEAPTTPGIYTVDVSIADGQSQFNDQVVQDNITILVKEVEIDFVDLPDAAETCTGGVLCLNDDDDNQNNVPDLNESGLVAGENELMSVTINKQPAMGNVDIATTYFGQGRIAMWEDALKTVPAASSYPASAMPLQLWVEGTEASIAERDILVTVSCGNGLPCADSLRLTVIAVVDMAFSGVEQPDGETNFQPGGNPSQYGGGDRIYPGRNYLPGTSGGKDAMHNEVNINVTLSAPLPLNSNTKVHFRLMDPDHYSTSAQYDPNGVQAPDDNVAPSPNPLNPILNIGAEVRDLITGQQGTAVSFQGTGTKKVFSAHLVINHLQPGNNWVAIADCKEDALQRVEFESNGQTLKSGPLAFAPPWPADKQTDKLTVWRKLYYEFDRMEDPDFSLDQPGRSQFLATGSGPVVKDVANNRIVLLNMNSIHGIVPGEEDQFAEGGKIDLLIDPTTGPDFWVTADVLANNSGVNPWVVPNYSVGRVIRWKNLRDDDITNTSAHKVTTSEDMGPADMFDLWVPKLEPALITPIDTSTQINNLSNLNVPFQHQVGTEAVLATEVGQYRNIISANKQASSSPGFWLVYQLGIFQLAVHRDTDPRSSGLYGGVSLGSNAWPDINARDDIEAGTMIFAESLREWSEIRSLNHQEAVQVTSVHEVAHQFELQHIPTHGSIMFEPGSLGIMHAGQTFGNAGFRFMMTTLQPGHNPH